MRFLQFVNTLSWPQWLLLAGVPVAIISLYFLKLRRQPFEVPSTYLWSRTIEDLHVNSIWQRLRRSLLLFLQLLAILLLIFTLLRPGFRGTDLVGDRFIFLIDTSASMSATDITPNRLEDAKKKAIRLIQEMKSGDVAMIMTASNMSRVEQPWTKDRRMLLKKVRSIRATNRTSNIEEALRYATALANPGRSSFELSDEQAPEALPATMYIFSDGKFQTIPNLFLGNLSPVYVPIGSDTPRNVAIVEFSADRNVEKPDETQAFARIENYSAEEVTIELTLHLNDRLIDATKTTIAAANDSGPGVANVAFQLSQLEQGVLKVEFDTKDDLTIDNVAYAAVNPPRRARILVVTPGVEPLMLALSTSEALKIADVSEVDPRHLQTPEYEQSALSGEYDLIIFDRCQPKKMPQCNTLFLGAIPPGDEWKKGEEQIQPLIVDFEQTHPLMHLVELGDVDIYRSFMISHPEGGLSLIDSDNDTTLLAIAPRQGYEDAVLAMSILDEVDGKTIVNTDWIIRRSFPVFVLNVVKYLGGSRGALGIKSIRPGDTAMLSTTIPTNEIVITDPDGERRTVLREGHSMFVYTKTEQTGVYRIREGKSDSIEQGFAVNLFHPLESDILPRSNLQLRHETIEGTPTIGKTRRELWKWVLLIVIGVVTFEWYIYNRRVYL
jgi:hypothetical protein